MATAKKPPFQAPGTTFSFFGDEVRLEGRHAAREKLSIRTLGSAPRSSYPPNYGSMGKFGATAELQNVLQGKRQGRGSSCRFVTINVICFVDNATQVMMSSTPH